MKRSLLFLSLLLLVALALCLAACGEGEPAETSNLPVTSCGTTTVSTPEATTVTTAEATTVTTSTMNTTIGDVFPFLFYTLSEKLYIKSNLRVILLGINPDPIRYRTKREIHHQSSCSW